MVLDLAQLVELKEKINSNELVGSLTTNLKVTLSALIAETRLAFGGKPGPPPDWLKSCVRERPLLNECRGLREHKQKHGTPNNEI
jgi:hypothetical protein